MEHCSTKNGQLAKKLNNREVTEYMVILQAYSYTPQGKQVRTAQHRITN